MCDHPQEQYNNRLSAKYRHMGVEVPAHQWMSGKEDFPFLCNPLCEISLVMGANFSHFFPLLCELFVMRGSTVYIKSVFKFNALFFFKSQTFYSNKLVL